MKELDEGSSATGGDLYGSKINEERTVGEPDLGHRCFSGTVFHAPAGGAQRGGPEIPGHVCLFSDHVDWQTYPYLSDIHHSILLLPLLGAVKKQSVAFGTLGFDIIWLMVAAFVLTSAMSHSNLGKRIALVLVTRFGKTPAKTLLVLVLVNFILAFFVPSTTARASLIVPLALVILEVYKAQPGHSNFGRLMMLQGVQNNAFATSVVMTATSAQVLALGLSTSRPAVT